MMNDYVGIVLLLMFIVFIIALVNMLFFTDL